MKPTITISLLFSVKRIPENELWSSLDSTNVMNCKIIFLNKNSLDPKIGSKRVFFCFCLFAVAVFFFFFFLFLFFVGGGRYKGYFLSKIELI